MVSLEWNDEDVVDVWASQFGGDEPYETSACQGAGGDEPNETSAHQGAGGDEPHETSAHLATFDATLQSDITGIDSNLATFDAALQFDPTGLAATWPRWRL